jgi:hypothetical protein
MRLTNEEFTKYAALLSSADKPSSQRIGQWLFNVLYVVSPETANSIRGTDVDPFYSDSKLKLQTFIDEIKPDPMMNKIVFFESNDKLVQGTIVGTGNETFDILTSDNRLINGVDRIYYTEQDYIDNLSKNIWKAYYEVNRQLNEVEEGFNLLGQEVQKLTSNKKLITVQAIKN